MENEGGWKMNDMENEGKTIVGKHNSYSNFIRYLYIFTYSDITN